MDQTGNTETRM